MKDMDEANISLSVPTSRSIMDSVGNYMECCPLQQDVEKQSATHHESNSSRSREFREERSPLSTQMDPHVTTVKFPMRRFFDVNHTTGLFPEKLCNSHSCLSRLEVDTH